MPEILRYQTPQPDPDQLPGSLVAVAWIHIAFGILAVIHILTGLFQSSCNFDLNVLTILIGRGLLRRNASARTWALVLLWIEMILTPIVVITIFQAPGPLKLTIGPTVITGVPVILVVLWPAASFALAIWQYRVLIRPNIRALFIQPPMTGW